MNYEKTYKKIYEWFQYGHRFFLLKFFYRVLPYVTAVIYASVIADVLFMKKDIFTVTKLIAVPAAGFVAVTVFRKLADSERPYTRYNITPLISKDKKGESFPSRHTFSITIIAMAVLYVNLPLGIFMCILSFIMAATRVLAGVHFIKDVCVAMLIAVIMGGVLWLI